MMQETIVPKLIKIFEALYQTDFGKSTRMLLLGEMEQFAGTIIGGERVLNEIMEQYRVTKSLPGTEVFKLYDTYGFPVELTQEFAGIAGYQVDMPGFETAMEHAKDISRQGSQQMFAKQFDLASLVEGMTPTEFV